MKALLFFTALSFFMVGAVITFREPDTKAQTRQEEPAGSRDSEPFFDSTVDRLSRKVEAAEAQPKTIIKTRVVYRYKAPKADRQVTSVAIVTDSSVYEVPAVQFGSVARVDGAELARALKDPQAEIIEVPVEIDTVIADADKHISAWQAVKEFVTRPFRKRP